MIAVDGRLPLAFTSGLLAAINPCGFVLLPTYLMYFLGMENARPGAQRTSIRRALAVSLSVSAGFLSVFIVLGVVAKWATNSILDAIPYISLVIGVALIVLGGAMIFGYRLPFTAPKLSIGERDRSVVSMFVFGIAYAIASFGCTLGPFTGVVLGAISTEGIAVGVAALALYGLGMALLVTALTVALAMANVTLLRFLRKGMQWFDYIAGIFVLLTGVYLTYYWYSSITENFDSSITSQATSWQEELSRFVQRNQATVVTIACAVIVAAIAVSMSIQRRPQAE